MIYRRFIIPCIVVLCTPALAEPLTPTKVDLANVLSSLEIVADYTEDPLVRVTRINGSGECDEGNEARTCPKSQLVIVPAADAEGPSDPRAWQTPRRIGWTFVKWTEKPNYDAKQSVHAALEATACEAPLAVESGKTYPRKGGRWHVIHFDMRVDGHRASVRRLNSYANAKDCDLY